MAKKPTYEELRKRVKDLEKELVKCRQAESALRASEEKHRTLFDNANDAVFIADVKTGVILDTNKEAERLMGRSKKKIIGTHQSQLHPTDQVKHYREKFRKHIRKHRTADFEAEIVRKDGTTVPVYISAAVMDLQGKKVIQGVFTDITERKKLEEELRVKDSAIASAINAIAFSDIEGNLTYVNDSFLRLWGYNENEVLGKPAVSFWDAEDTAAWVVDTLRAKGGWIGELIAKRKDGSLMDTQVSASLVTGDEGAPICMMASFLDITNRKRVERALVQSEEKYRKLFETSTDGILVIDIETRNFKYANPALCRLLGYSEEEIRGLRLSDVRPKDKLEYVISEFQAHVKGEKTLAEVIPFLRKDGTIVYVDITATTAMIDGRNCSIGFLRDITLRRQAEEALKEREATLQIRTKELEEVNSALRVLLKRREDDKTELEEKVLLNVRALVAPYVDKLKKSRLDTKQMAYLNILESNLNSVVSPFAHTLSSIHLRLTPAEIQTAHLVKDGKTTKQIAEQLNVSDRTVEFHRKRIRTKLGLKNKKVNLRSHLSSMTN